MKHDYHYISKHDPTVVNAYERLVNIIKEVQNIVRSDFTFQFYAVGSYSRNMITYDKKSNIGYDFDINIEVNDEDNQYSAKQIRCILRDALNKVVTHYGYDYPEDSTRVLTIKYKDRNSSRIIHSCDFAIVNNYIDEDGTECQEYIRFNKSSNSYGWYEQPKGYYMLPEKISWLKSEGLWGDLRDLYIVMKNENTDKNIHSRAVFAKAVHQICQQNGFYSEN